MRRILLPVLMLIGCAKEPAPIAPSAPAVTKATEAVFEERTVDGELVWRVTAASVGEESGIIRCENLYLKTWSPSGDGATGPKGVGAMEARSAVGLIRTGDSITVELESGFTLETENGWKAQGGSALWNGSILTARENVIIERIGTTIRGRSATIDPKRNVIRMRNVSGVIENLSL